MSEEELTIEEKVELWKTHKNLLDISKAREMELRRDICNHILEENKGKQSGMKLIGNLKLKAKIGVNVKFDEPLFNTLFDDLSDEEKSCVKFKPQLVSKNLKELDESSQLFLCITEEPSTPTLEIVGEVDLESIPK